jgi:hypothetical protein
MVSFTGVSGGRCLDDTVAALTDILYFIMLQDMHLVPKVMMELFGRN